MAGKTEARIFPVQRLPREIYLPHWNGDGAVAYPAPQVASSYSPDGFLPRKELSHQLMRNLGIGSYRTAWFLAHRIREAMALSRAEQVRRPIGW